MSDSTNLHQWTRLLSPKSSLLPKQNLRATDRSMPRLAYISAASHSGSTLLAMLLGSHSEVCTVGEIKANKLGDPERYRCSCGELIRKCSFWTTVSARMAEKGFEYEVTRARTSIHGCEDKYILRLLTPLHRGPLLESCRDLA